MRTKGFSKLSAYKAFSKMNKSCAQGCKCSALCQLYMAKEFLSLSAQTGEKFTDKIPEDILDMFRSVPLIPERYKNMELQEAFVEVQSICDDCSIDEHDSFCTVNVVLTALGILLEGNDFVTDKDKEIES
ncbi:MAG TPA: nitrite reductase [Desulfosporosinus sp.]|nr:nitrite reductase [Desulfosporosinus sp.]